MRSRESIYFDSCHLGVVVAAAKQPHLSPVTDVGFRSVYIFQNVSCCCQLWLWLAATHNPMYRSYLNAARPDLPARLKRHDQNP